MNKQTETKTATANIGLGSVRQGITAFILIASLTGLMIYSVDRITAPRIANNLTAQAMQIIEQVLPNGMYDNQPHTDIYPASSISLLGSSQTMPAYRARLGDRAVAVVLTTEAPDGYVGPIRMLIAVANSGKIIDLRTLQHKETPGLGDKIDADKSTWLQQFKGASLNKDGVELTLRSDGGYIDHISGATITSRSVTKAVNNTLLYFVKNRQALLAPANDHEADLPR